MSGYTLKVASGITAARRSCSSRQHGVLLAPQEQRRCTDLAEAGRVVGREHHPLVVAAPDAGRDLEALGDQPLQDLSDSFGGAFSEVGEEGPKDMRRLDGDMLLQSQPDASKHTSLESGRLAGLA